MIRFFDLALQINGFPIKEAQAKLRKIISFSEKEYEDLWKNLNSPKPIKSPYQIYSFGERMIA